MSSRELERAEVMGRVESGDLKLSDAAVMLELSYRQAKRLWRRYGQVGSEGLKHGNAGQPSNRGKPMKLRRRVLNLIKKKYSGAEEERFGPTLAAEHLAEEDAIVMDHETLRRWMLAERLWSRQRPLHHRGHRIGFECWKQSRISHRHGRGDFVSHRPPARWPQCLRIAILQIGRQPETVGVCGPVARLLIVACESDWRSIQLTRSMPR